MWLCLVLLKKINAGMYDLEKELPCIEVFITCSLLYLNEINYKNLFTNSTKGTNSLKIFQNNCCQHHIRHTLIYSMEHHNKSNITAAISKTKSIRISTTDSALSVKQWGITVGKCHYCETIKHSSCPDFKGGKHQYSDLDDARTFA